MLTSAIKPPIAVIGLKTILEEGVVARLERKAVKNTTRIYDFVSQANGPVTIKQIQVALDMKPGIASGSLASLLASNKLVREQVSKPDGTLGRKILWAYKPVAIPQQNAVESVSE